MNFDQLRKRKVRKEESATIETSEGPIDRMDSFEEEAAHADPERPQGAPGQTSRLVASSPRRVTSRSGLSDAMPRNNIMPSAQVQPFVGPPSPSVVI